MKIKRLLVLLSVIISFILPHYTVAYAESSSYLKINVTTDKQSYSKNQEVKYDISVSNSSGNEAKNVVVTSKIPDSLEVSSKDIKMEKGKLVWSIAKIDGFSKATLSFSAKLKKDSPAAPPVDTNAGEESAPNTGDSTNTKPFYLLLSISLVVLIGAAVALKRNSLKKPVSFLIILAMVLPSFSVAKAEQVKESVKESATVTINNKEYKLTFTVEAVLDVDSMLLLTATRSYGLPQLQWNSVDRAVYQVKRGQTPGKLAVIAKDLTDTSFADNNSKPAEKYYYQVAAFKDGKQLYQSSILLLEGFVDGDKDGLADKDETTAKTDKKKPDTDGDTLKDGDEVYLYQTNPLKKDTDVDGLSDSYEVSYFTITENLDPTKSDTDDNGTLDSKEDFDKDGLTTAEEQELQTDPFEKDTDGDGLLDNDEVSKHKTNPTVKDTDNDMLDDGSELKFATNPLVKDTDGDGILDGLEKREQTISAAAQNVQLTINATGDVDKTTKITEAKNINTFVNDAGIVGQPVDITTKSQFDSASLAFKYDPTKLGVVKPENLAVFYFNPTTKQLELVKEQQVNQETSTVTANLEHFSTYVLGDISMWSQSWQDNNQSAPAGDNTEKTKPLDLVLVIDSSGSMLTNDPNDVRIQGAKNIIESLKEGDQAAVIGDRGSVVDFDSYAYLLEGLTENKQELINAVGQIDSSGGTNIGAGVSVALSEIETNGRTDADKAIILLTDGEGSYSTSLTTKAKSMGVKISTIGLGNNIDRTLLQAIADGTDGDFYYAESADNLADVLERSKDQLNNRDTDGDTIPDWVEKLAEENGGFILKDSFTIPFIGKEIKVQHKFVTDFNKPDTDDDMVSDVVELGGLKNIYVSEDKTKVYLKLYPRSNPKLPDTDDDGDDDKKDDKPLDEFISPVVLLHGINSNTARGWGAVTNDFDNNGAIKQMLDKVDYQAYIKSDISPENTYTKTGYSKGDYLDYGNIDLNYITETSVGELAWELDFDYTANETLFAFNWEANGHINHAASSLSTYLNGITDYLDNKDIDITKGSTPYFNLVGHSAGGLVSRYYIENIMDSDGPVIEKLVTVATPHWGSNEAWGANNTGVCGKVLQDLDRDDSYLFYNDGDNQSFWCSKPGDNFSLNNHDTKYYSITGIQTDDYFDGNSHIISVPNSKADSSLELFNYFRSEFKSKTGNEFPMLKNDESGIEDSSGTNEPGYRGFGDRAVAGGSGLGIPSDKQKKKESRLKSLPIDKRYLMFGDTDDVMHTNINHRQKTFDWVIDRIKE